METDDSYVFTLTVPNAKIDPNVVALTVTKKIAGNMGDRTKEFDFTFRTNNISKTYDWTLNGVVQTQKLSGNGGQFKLGDGDEAIIMVPKGTVVTVSENPDGYTPSLVFNGETPEDADNKIVTMSDDSRLEFTNTYKTEIPTGVWFGAGGLLIMLLIIVTGMVWTKRRGIRYGKMK